MLLIFLTLLSLISNTNGIEQIHLSLTGKPSETYITWTTLNKTRNNYINYGINNKFKEDDCYLNNTLTKIDTNIFNNDNFDKNGRITYIHYGLLTNLVPNKYYCYQIYNEYNTSQVYTFRMVDYQQKETSILLLGDYSDDNNNLTATSIYNKQNTFDFMVHNGDIAYDMFEQNGITGDDYMNKLQFISARNYYMTTPGNHERYYNFSHYKNRFKNPGLVSNRMDNYYWSMEFSNFKLITINTDLYYDDMGVPIVHPTDNDVSIGSLIIQYKWLKKEIHNYRHNKNTKNNSIIVMGHHPLYCSNINHLTLVSTCQGYRNQTYILRDGWGSHKLYSLEDLLYNYKVDLYVSSHVHAYERLYPSYNSKILQYNYNKPDTYIHLMTGNAGVISDMANFTNKIPLSAYQLSGNVSYGYGILYVKDKTIKWEQYDALSNDVIDNISIIRRQGHQ
jgi:acid phosphatase type 7